MMIKINTIRYAFQVKSKKEAKFYKKFHEKENIAARSWFIIDGYEDGEIE